MVNMYHFIERAVLVHREYKLDRQYVVRDGEIVIVDEFTGRLAEGRKWRDGLHQAVEAKQGVEVTVETGQAARITIQDFFLRYEKLAGMTGTAIDSAGRVAANLSLPRGPDSDEQAGHPRSGCRTQVFGTEEAKWEAVVEEVCRAARHRPAGADRHAVDRQIRSPLAAACGRAACSTRCSTPTTSRAEAEIVGRPARRAASPSPRTWPAAAPTSSSAPAWPISAGCTSFSPKCTTPRASTAS